MKTLREAWEKRAAEKGKTLNSVLLKGLPPRLNEYIHEFHLSIIRHELIPRLKERALVLDLACGYGRVTYPLLNYKNLEFIGLDFSIPYCTEYKKYTHQEAICSDFQSMPFKEESFDAIIGITALMYIENNREQILFNILNTLKPGGLALFIDPGKEFASLVNFFKNKSGETSGHPFTKKEYRALFEHPSLKIIAAGGMPIFSISLPALILIKSKKIMQCIKACDHKLSRLDRFSLHRWILVQKIE